MATGKADDKEMTSTTPMEPAPHTTLSIEERHRLLRKKHQRLFSDWKRKKGLCIICGENEGNEKDHLPPKVLFPEGLRKPDTDFLTFPVCSSCNRASSDEDFLFSVLLSFGLNQESIVKGQEPTDPDLRALYAQALAHFTNPEKSLHRQQLLSNYIVKDPETGRLTINSKKVPVNQTATKIVKSIYWLHTGGDILQKYNPGWWIIPCIDASKPHFIEKHLKTTSADIQWGDRFISHFTFGHPDDGVGGFISCSLHFYTKTIVGRGLSWLLIALPSTTRGDGINLYERFSTQLGLVTIKPY